MSKREQGISHCIHDLSLNYPFVGEGVFKGFLKAGFVEIVPLGGHFCNRKGTSATLFPFLNILDKCDIDFHADNNTNS